MLVNYPLRTDYDLRRERQNKRLHRVVRVLKHYHLANRHARRKGLPLNYSFTYDAERSLAYVSAHGMTYCVWDNGGEYGVQKVNARRLPTFAPVADSTNAGTVAGRVAALIRGESVDLQFSLSDEEDLDLLRV